MSERVPLFGEITGDGRPLAVAAAILPPLEIRISEPVAERIVLVVRREGEDLWEPPIGVLGANEGLTQCVKRAVLEQAGLEVAPSHPTVLYENTAHPARPITIGWRCKANPEQPTRPGVGIAEVAWIPLSEAGNRVSPVADTVLHDGNDLLGDFMIEREHDGYETTKY